MIRDDFTFTFTFMHLADAFIQSDLHCIQVTVSTFLSALAFPGNRTHDLGVANAMLYQLSYRKDFRSVDFDIGVPLPKSQIHNVLEQRRSYNV